MQRITLKTAIEHLTQHAEGVTIATRPQGYAIIVGGDVIRSRREDELTFLTYDGAINYVRRHLDPPIGRQLRIVIEP